MSSPVPLSDATTIRLRSLFAGADARDAELLLVHECGTNLPFLENEDARGLERFRFAALKLGGGDLAKLREAVELAKADWRDLLVAAGFADDTSAHERWLP